MFKIQLTSLHTLPITRQRHHPAPKYCPLLPDTLPSLDGVELRKRLVKSFQIITYKCIYLYMGYSESTKIPTIQI